MRTAFDSCLLPISSSLPSFSILLLFFRVFIGVYKLHVCLLSHYSLRFVLMVKHGYRNMPYHNWWHGLSVAHFCYLLYRNCDGLSLLSDIEWLSLFLSCLCHDIDHRGTNNAFQVSSVSLRQLVEAQGADTPTDTMAYG